MARQFDILITGGTAVGPYTVYYNSVSPSTYAIRVSTGLNATGISYSDLVTSPGVRVSVPNDATILILYNGPCNQQITFPIFQGTPTPTPTLTPTTTLLKTPSPTPTLTQTKTPSPTPTKRTIVPCSQQTTYYWVLRRSTRAGNTILDRGDVVPVETASNGNIISARLIGLATVYRTSPFILRYSVYSVEIYDCNNTLCCVVYSVALGALLANLYYFYFQTNLVQIGNFDKVSNTFCDSTDPKYDCAKFTLKPYTLPFNPKETFTI